MSEIVNPVLRGFNPDPSILRVGDDYYIATSTFEWFPGVQIHHSKDLVHWRLVARPLDRLSQLDMRCVSDSGGVWAPCLSHDGREFHLVYTNVTHFDRNLFYSDTENFLVTSKDIPGRWSEPVYLNASGFDPSLFHDAGRKWLVNMLWDHRQGRTRFGGIVLQEYNPRERRLTGPVRNIFGGTELGITEGPHLYKVGEFYYLMTAEGGTSYGHAVTFARSSAIEGPYEVHPQNPLVTSRDDPTLPLQKAGHGSLVKTQTGEWYLAHLCARPLARLGRCPLGRETALQKVVWGDDRWPRIAAGGNAPAVKVPAPSLKPCPWPKEPERDDFDASELGIHFQTLRVPLGEDMLSLKERPGHLRLKGRHFLNSSFTQAFVARRQQAFKYTAITCVEFEPDNFHEMAGLVCFYDTDTFYYLRVTWDERKGKVIGIISSDRGKCDYPMDADLGIAGWKRVFLKARVDRAELRFYYSQDGREWLQAGPALDASRLSDEYASDYSFTGAFVGLSCQDLSGRSRHADFDFFEYVEDDK